MISRRGVLAAGLTVVGGAIVPDHFKLLAQETGQKHLIAEIWPEPTTLAVIGTVPIDVVNGNIADGLVYYDNNYQPQPELALSWETSEDGKSITFHLRPDVKWHDGHPFTSEDVAFSILEVVPKASALGATAYKDIVAVDTPDPLTVIIRLAKPSPVIWSYLDAIKLRLVPKRLYEGIDPLTNPQNNTPVATGPFKLKEWVRGSHITLERNPDYWDKGKPYLDLVTFRIIPEAAAREAALEAGELHYAAHNPIAHSSAQRLRNSKELIVDTKGWEGASKVFFFDFNLRREVFQDVRVRRAFAHALDRQALTDIVFYGLARPSHGPIPTTQVQFYNPDAPDYPYDPKRAEELLDEAGYPRGADGVRLRVNHVNHSFGDVYKRAGDLFKQQLKAIGVELELINYDTATQLRKIFVERDFDTSSIDYAPFSDPQIGVIRRYWSKSIQDGVPWSNGSLYSSPDTDKVIEGIIAEADAAKRKELINQLQVIAQTDLPSISLVDIYLFRVYSSRLKGVSDTPWGVYRPFTNVTIAS